MAPRRKIRQKEAQLAFDALTIEGGLLSPEWLARAAQTKASQQTEADYRVPKGLHLRDEVGRYWRMAQAHWHEFTTARLAGGDAQQVTERFAVGLLRSCFGFESLQAVVPVDVAGRTFPIGYQALGGHVPVVIAPVPAADNVKGLEVPFAAFGDAGRKRSAFGLAQEYLNATDSALWGVATDGVTLRIVRDNASLTRPAWLEADLQRIFAEERYADFAALWLVLHESRFGRADQPPSDCALEAWRTAGREEGTRAREHLRRGVEDALKDLGQGFLSHPDNVSLRTALHDGSLTTTAYFQQLLRLVYRMIFLLTVEERGLLHPDTTPEATRSLYEKGYSLRRLRERAVKRSAHDRYADLWQATRIVFRGLVAGEAKLGLPALAGIFAADRCPALDTASLENRALLLAMFRLSWLREPTGLSRVNWRDMGPEELGSVYESLLELVPQVTGAGRTFAFATGDETRGNARKTTGSYYSPDSLVQVLLDSALEPVIQSTIAANPLQPVDALLQLTIVDPACGSGHFLLAAADRLAGHVARLAAGGTATVAGYRHALRQVMGNCIYGVDLNPMAVELCKVALWTRAVEPGLPLNFLDAHIQQGNALLGATPDQLEKGVPDAAWEAFEGDDKKAAAALKKRNKTVAAAQTSLLLFGDASTAESAAVARDFAELEAAGDADLEALKQKEARFAKIQSSPEYEHQRFVADAWCAAFMWPKQFRPLHEHEKTALGEATRKLTSESDVAPTNALWQQVRNAPKDAPPLMMETVQKLSRQYRFFHWHLAFPQVFSRGGFNVVLGNPPYLAPSELCVRALLAFLAPEARPASNLAADFLLLPKRITARAGLSGLVVPKSLSFSSAWDGVRSELLPRLRVALDAGKAWDEVLLEQIIITQGSPRPFARDDEQVKVGVLTRAGPVWRQRPLSLMTALSIIPTGADDQDLECFAAAAPNATLRFADICSTQRGFPLQKFIREDGQGVLVVAGKDIGGFSLRPSTKHVERTVLTNLGFRPLEQPKAAFQNIIAHLTRPAPHIKLIGTVLKGECVALDTVNLLESPMLSPWAITAYLSSNFVNWYVYVCVFNRAIRTMHFDGFVLRKLPFPEKLSAEHLDRLGRAIEHDPSGREAWLDLNTGIYDALDLASNQRAHIEALHQPRWAAQQEPECR